ncbi:MAG: polyprenyl diphosphate synthase, partial [Planctomycetia bacterium]
MATTPASRAGERVTATGADGLPRHIAIIMDGNGRWARQRGLPRIDGHRRGVATVRRVTEHCARLGVEQLTLYCLSSENWRRPAAELDFLMHLLEQYLIEERSLLMREGIRVVMIGSRAGLPEATLAALDRTTAMCAGNDGMRLCLAVNYGSRAEI